MIFRKTHEQPVSDDGMGEAPPSAPTWRRVWLPRIAAGTLFVFLLLIAWLVWTAPLGKSLEPLETPALVLEAADGSAIARRGQFKAEPVDVADLPPHVPNAFIAIEDQRFYDHWGLDPRGIARAAVANAEAGGVVQGGSTLTQQLAKTSFLSSERSFKRKAQEALIALWLEAWLSKEDILSRYLSSVYFGEGAYGLRAAARTYFAKPPEQLTLGEAAMLAGLMKAPSRLAPTKNYEGARARGKLVIAAMREQGLITQEEWNSARPAQIRRGRDNLPIGDYFADWVYEDALRIVGERYGEARVRTTLDPKLQRAAERALRNQLVKSSASQGALVAMRPNGRVVAMVGGLDYKESAFNRAAQAKRQSGSAFKPFVYLTALQQGWRPESSVADSPLTLGDWSPENYDGSYAGQITLRQAFAKSSNVAAARIAEDVGVRAIQRTARRLGIESELEDDLTIALGTSSTTLLELTAAYAAIAGGMAPVEPFGIENARSGWSDRVDAFVRRAGGVPQRREMLRLMRAVVEEGTAEKARLNVPSFGKTGTTQDHRDALFIGFVKDLVVGIWVGNDDNSPMRGVTGSNVPAAIWRDFMVASSPAIGLRRPKPPERRRDSDLDPGALLARILGADFEAARRGDLEAARRVAERLARGAFDPDDVERELERMELPGLDPDEIEDRLEDIEDARRDAEDAAEDMERARRDRERLAAERRARERALEANERAMEELERALAGIEDD